MIAPLRIFLAIRLCTNPKSSDLLSKLSFFFLSLFVTFELTGLLDFCKFVPRAYFSSSILVCCFGSSSLTEMFKSWRSLLISRLSFCFILSKSSLAYLSRFLAFSRSTFWRCNKTLIHIFLFLSFRKSKKFPTILISKCSSKHSHVSLSPTSVSSRPTKSLGCRTWSSRHLTKYYKIEKVLT